MATVNEFESLLVGSGIQIIKYYLDISKQEQALRLKSRATDPLKQWKISPIDEQAQRKWKAYSIARDQMLLNTSTLDAPWTVIDANDKKLTHLNLIANLLSRVNYPIKAKKIFKVDPQILQTVIPQSKKLPKLFP